MEAREEIIRDNGYALTSQYDLLSRQMQDMQLDNLRVSFTHEIEKNNTRIDSLDASLNGRIDDMKTIVDKTYNRISNMLVIFGIAFAGIFPVLGVILAQLLG